MTESLSSLSVKAGLPPGSLIHIGEKRQQQSRVFVVDYDRQGAHAAEVASVAEIQNYKDKDSVTWVNIEGLSDIGLIEEIGRQFNIHSLVLEDILNTQQRPKLEEYDNYLYIVLKGMLLAQGEFAVVYEQISIILTDKFVFTFKEKRDEIFSSLTRRIHNGKGPLRVSGPDYLTYAIVDSVVDQYFTVQDGVDTVVDALEDKLLESPDEQCLAQIQRLKRELVYIRKSISPVRELLNGLLRSDSTLIQDKNRVYFRDVYDHVLRVSEAIETNREMLSGLLDIYISSISNKMNEVMKVLTVFAAIFIPLTFLAGIYGMNFEYMPELRWKWSYP
ncbi:MAG: magnesium/cobalt transporter CorA, partial [Gammaproteobacteria bacterium]